MSESKPSAGRGVVGLEDGTPYREEVSHFVDALEALLAERSLGAISPSDIALQANRTVALFFKCFKDERGPMSLLVSRLIADRLETSAASFSPDRWKTASLHEIIRSALGYLVTLVRPDDPVSRASAEASLDDQELMDLRRSALTYDVELFRRLLASRSSELSDDDLSGAISLAARQVLVTLDREMLLGGDDQKTEELAEQLVEVVERLIGLRGPQVRLSAPEEPGGDESERPVLLALGMPDLAELMEKAVSSASLRVRIELVGTPDEVMRLVATRDVPAVFMSWAHKEAETREVLHRVREASATPVVTVVLTSGSPDELSMAYALGARVAVPQPEDPDSFLALLARIDELTGA